MDVTETYSTDSEELSDSDVEVTIAFLHAMYISNLHFDYLQLQNALEEGRLKPGLNTVEKPPKVFANNTVRKLNL